MKILGILGGFLMLLGSVCGIEDVHVTCSEYWIQVNVRRTLFKADVQPQIHELHLGNRCPATSTLPDHFEFLYTITSCGIRTNRYPWGMLITTFLTYEPARSNSKGIMPLYCFIQRNYSFRFVPKGIETNSGTSETSNLPVTHENSTLSQIENLMEIYSEMSSWSSSSFEGQYNSVHWS